MTTRASVFSGTVNAAGASAIVSCKRADFRRLVPDEPPLVDADALLVDVPCSGSGTGATRGDDLLRASRGEAAEDGIRAKGDSARLAGLAEVQATLLMSALQAPRAKRIVYSTCSIHQEECEDVVAKVLPTARSLGFDLAPALPAWPRRGRNGTKQSLLEAGGNPDLLLRTDPAEDFMDGFFVALFERKLQLFGSRCAASPAVSVADASSDPIGGGTAGGNPYRRKRKRKQCAMVEERRGRKSAAPELVEVRGAMSERRCRRLARRNQKLVTQQPL